MKVTWRVYVDALFRERQRALDAALAAQKEVLREKERTLDTRLIGLQDELSALRSRVDISAGEKHGSGLTVERMITVAAVLIALGTLIAYAVHP